MSAPTKPWEQSNLTQTQTQMQNNSSAFMNTYNTPVGRFRAAPVVPPRPHASNYMNTNYSHYSGYGGGMNSMMYNRGLGYSPYSAYGGGYSGYGGMGGMYGGYGFNGASGYGPENRFIELAEQSTRPAFQSIESLVQTFSSVSMMLDSTFFAMTNSFRAVLGVAENFGRLRSMFGQFWSSFALFRFINWLYKKLLSTLGVRSSTEMGNEMWNQALNEVVSSPTQNQSGWPIFVFLGLIISAPYLISRLTPPVVDNRNPKNWNPRGYPVKVNYEFIATNPQELTVRPGEVIRLAPTHIQKEMNLGKSGWAYAASSRGVGLVPMNYLQVLAVPATSKNSQKAEPSSVEAFTESQTPAPSSQTDQVETENAI